MKPLLKSELRKVFSIRSTYILCLISLALIVLYDFYVIGFKLAPGEPGNHLLLVNEVTRARGIVPPIIIGSLVAILLMAHEYRYNTISYTLTAANNRQKALLAKMVMVSGFALVFSAVVGVISPLLAQLGIHAHHVVTVHQVFYYRDFAWRVLFFGWAYAMLALLLTVLLRNIVASIVAILLIPATIEPLLSLFLRNNSVYLPFTALTAVLNNGLSRVGPHELTAERSAFVVIVYLVIGWAIAWFLFLKRDANQ